MDCDRAQELLSAGMEDPGCAGHDEAMGHAERCPACDGFHRALRTLGSLPSPAAPPGFTERVMARIEALEAEGVSTDVGPTDRKPRRLESIYAAVPWLATAAIILVALGMWKAPLSVPLGMKYFKSPSTYPVNDGAVPTAVEEHGEQAQGPAPEAAPGSGTYGDAVADKAISDEALDDKRAAADGEAPAGALSVTQSEGAYRRFASAAKPAVTTAERRPSTSVVVFQGRVYVPMASRGTRWDGPRPTEGQSAATGAEGYRSLRARHPVDLQDIPELRGFDRPRFMGIDAYGRAVFVSEAAPLEIVTFDHHDHMFKRWRATP